MYQRFGKRALDLAIVLPALLLLAPLLGGIALLVRAALGRPVLFRQQRPGRDGRPFMLYKFRSMADARDAGGNPLPDAERLTPLGRLLRSTSLDELPELWNVLRGDMSLVGPRPLLMQYLDRYTPKQARRHEVRPGITGWAQVNGRNALTWEQKLALDVWYVDHVRLETDARIMVATIGLWLRREGINQPGEATMREFTPLPLAGDFAPLAGDFADGGPRPPDGGPRPPDGGPSPPGGGLRAQADDAQQQGDAKSP